MKLKNILFFAALGVGALTSCSDDTTPVLELQQAATLNAITPAEVVINKDNCQEQFPEISWEKANYGKGAVVTYTVTLTNNDAQKSVDIASNVTENKLSFTKADMNSILESIGAYPGKQYNFTVSLKSNAYDTYVNDAANTVSFQATPYDPNVDNIDWNYAYVAVGYPNWDVNKAYVIGDPDGDGTYKGYAQFDDACTYAILDGKTLEPISEGNSVDGKGFREISVNKDGDFTQSAPTTWGLIGDATSGGWNSDTQMEYDEDTRMWTCTTSLIGGKEFKFRANSGWDINLGGDGTDNGLVANGGNIKVKKEHAYKVTLNLTNAGKYTYSMEETDIVLSSSFLTLPGSYQGWQPTADDCYKITSAARDFKYSGAYYFPAGTEFKLYDAGTWLGSVGGVQWSDDYSSASFAIGNGDNITIPKGGYYKVYADLQKNVASLTKTGWEVVGDATAGGWDKGDVLDYNPTTGVWSGTVTLKDGEFKFRWDGAWDYNFGGSISALVPGGDNIKASAGTYKFTLKVSADKSSATATMEEVK